MRISCYAQERQLARNTAATQRAKSKADFITKTAICEEEADEACYWLELIRDTKSLPASELELLLREAEELTAIMTASGKRANREPPLTVPIHFPLPTSDFGYTARSPTCVGKNLATSSSVRSLKVRTDQLGNGGRIYGETMSD